MKLGDEATIVTCKALHQIERDGDNNSIETIHGLSLQDHCSHKHVPAHAHALDLRLSNSKSELPEHANCLKETYELT